MPNAASDLPTTMTSARSLTIRLPTAMRPFGESSTPYSSGARSSTTVLATDGPSPNTRPAPKVQPHGWAMLTPSVVATTICPMAPGMATRRPARASPAAGRNAACPIECSSSAAYPCLLLWSGHPTPVVRVQEPPDDGASPGSEAAGVIV